MNAAAAPYVPLWCKSNHSFLEGASHPEELIETASQHGLSALALTDRDGVYGIVKAHVKARELGIKLIVGSEVTVGTALAAPTSTIVLLATDRAAYGRLCTLLTYGRRRAPKGSSLVTWDEVAEQAEGLIALWGGPRALLCAEAEPLAVFQQLRAAFSTRLYALLSRHRRAEERIQEKRLRQRAQRWDLPLVAATEVLYHIPARRKLQDVLACIRHGVTLATAGQAIQPNAEHELKTAHAFETLFSDVPQARYASREIAERCHFNLDALRYRYPEERLPSGYTAASWLRQLTHEGAQLRYGGQIPAAVSQQLEKELQLIEELEYGGYFLTMWEIVRYCREQAILCQGRGSAANSAVCYCLGITAVDPVRMDLLFERFLSKERAEPPDIDLDIAHERREEVIQHVYSKYGRSHAAMVAVLIRYRPRSAIRDVGKVFGLSETTLDRLAKLLPHWGEIPPAVLEQAGFAPGTALHEQLVTITSELLDFPRHLSIHPGGFLLGHEPVSTLVPIENATMDERTVIQWDKDDIEDLGLFKVDLLGLGALTQLDLCFRMIAEQTGQQLSMATLPPEDPATMAMIGRAETIGVFQIESRAQMAMLPRLKPRTFYDLVIEVSIVRPGPITGGMVHPYLRRRRGEEQVIYPHPSLQPVLEKTLGVPLFQEQVMKLAVVAADYTPGEADQLRRDMAAWRRTGRIEKHRSRLIERMTAKGITLEFAERVFEQIRGFGEYGFPESHAASFALISYATSYLRCHFPAEFVASLLNAQPMGFYSPATIIEDARRHGVEFRPIDVLFSDWHSTLEKREDGARAVRLGLRQIKGLPEEEARSVETARPFRGLRDLTQRTKLSIRSLQALAEAGAFDSFGLDRRQALWEIKRLARTRRQMLPVGERPVDRLFAPLTDGETIAWDYRTTSLSPRGHPLEILRPELARQGFPDARTLCARPHGSRVRFAGAVIGRQQPMTAKGTVFVTLEDETGLVNLVLWKDVFARHRLTVKTSWLLAVSGKLEAQDDVIHLIADRLWVPQVRASAPETTSRDFR